MQEVIGESALGPLCGKWTIPLVLELSLGARRYCELERALDGVSQRMLTLTLRRLEAEGIVSRAVHPGAPSVVEYALTASGEGAVGALRGLRSWLEARKGLGKAVGSV